MTALEIKQQLYRDLRATLDAAQCSSKPYISLEEVGIVVEAVLRDLCYLKESTRLDGSNFKSRVVPPGERDCSSYGR